MTQSLQNFKVLKLVLSKSSFWAKIGLLNYWVIYEVEGDFRMEFECLVVTDPSNPGLFAT